MMTRARAAAILHRVSLSAALLSGRGYDHHSTSTILVQLYYTDWFPWKLEGFWVDYTIFEGNIGK